MATSSSVRVKSRSRGVVVRARFLLILLLLFAWAGAATATNITVSSSSNPQDDDDDDDDDDDEDRHFNAFNSSFLVVLFGVATWLAGKVSALSGMPGLVGEIACGAILGPPAVNGVPHATALRSLGNVGLWLLFVEAGLHVDLETLEIVGRRGVSVGVGFTIIPLALAASCAMVGWRASFREAIVVGAALSTMSTGIALNVLKAGNALNRPIGQLVIAAATCNEILGIALLGVVRSLSRGSPSSGAEVFSQYVAPLLALAALVTFVGALAVSIIPKLLDKVLLPRLPNRRKRADAVLKAVFSAALILIPSCAYSGVSSALLGAFLAGLCFCSDRAVHTVWDTQVKRVLRWLLRIFFAASVGFGVPVSGLADPSALAKAGALLLVAWPGKLAAGIFAAPQFDWGDFWTLAFSWGCFGEVAFVIADLARDSIPESTYNAVVIAVILSIVASPFGLRRTLVSVERRARDKIEAAARDSCTTTTPHEAANAGSAAAFEDGAFSSTEDKRDDDRNDKMIKTTKSPRNTTKLGGFHFHTTSSSLSPRSRGHHHPPGGGGGGQRATYLCLQTRSPAHWALTDSLLRALQTKCHVEIIDFRSFHPNDHFGASHCVNEIYIRDAVVASDADARHAEIVAAVRAALDHGRGSGDGKKRDDVEIRLSRWRPGATAASSSSSGGGGAAPHKHHVSLGVASPRAAARPQRALSASSGRASSSPRIAAAAHRAPPTSSSASSAGAAAASPPPPPPPGRHVRTFSDPTALLDWSSEWWSRARALEAPEALTTTFRVRPSHELDGFVHTDCHRLPFDLPDDASDRDIDEALLNPDDEEENVGADDDDELKEGLVLAALPEEDDEEDDIEAGAREESKAPNDVDDASPRHTMG